MMRKKLFYFQYVGIAKTSELDIDKEVTNVTKRQVRLEYLYKKCCMCRSLSIVKKWVGAGDTWMLITSLLTRLRHDDTSLKWRFVLLKVLKPKYSCVSIVTFKTWTVIKSAKRKKYINQITIIAFVTKSYFLLIRWPEIKGMFKISAAGTSTVDANHLLWHSRHAVCGRQIKLRPLPTLIIVKLIRCIYHEFKYKLYYEFTSLNLWWYISIPNSSSLWSFVILCIVYWLLLRNTRYYHCAHCILEAIVLIQGQGMSSLTYKI